MILDRELLASLVADGMVRPPCGHHFMLAHGSPRHEVDEHDDGTISVQPKPSNSNSILCPECGWHGYIANGVWTT